MHTPFEGPYSLPYTDPRIELLLNRYRVKYGLQPTRVPKDGSKWLALTYRSKVAAIANINMLTPGLMVILNVCAVNSRYGILGVYEILRDLRQRVDDGELTGIIGNVLYRNVPFQRALAKAFGDVYKPSEYNPEPYALVYKYGVV